MAEAMPWFPLYAADFANDLAVISMSAEEVGVYIRLLCYAWTEDGIPATASTRLLASLARVSVEAMQAAWDGSVGECFESVDGRFRNPRMERVRAEQRAKADERSSAGRAGGIAAQARRRSAKASSKDTHPASDVQADLQASFNGASTELQRSRKHPESESEPDTETAAAVPARAREAAAEESAGGDEDEECASPPSPPVVSRAASPPRDLARRFVERGCALGQIELGRGGLSAQRTGDAMLQDALGIAALVVGVGVDAAMERAERFFAARASRRIHSLGATLFGLLKAWDFAEIAPPPALASAAPPKPKGPSIYAIMAREKAEREAEDALVTPEQRAESARKWAELGARLEADDAESKARSARTFGGVVRPLPLGATA